MHVYNACVLPGQYAVEPEMHSLVFKATIGSKSIIEKHRNLLKAKPFKI